MPTYKVINGKIPVKGENGLTDYVRQGGTVEMDEDEADRVHKGKLQLINVPVEKPAEEKSVPTATQPQKPPQRQQGTQGSNQATTAARE